MAAIGKWAKDLVIPFGWIGGSNNYSEIKKEATESLSAWERVALIGGTIYACNRWYDQIFFVSNVKAFSTRNILSIGCLSASFIPELRPGISVFVALHALNKFKYFVIDRLDGKNPPIQWVVFGTLQLICVGLQLDSYNGYLRTGNRFYSSLFEKVKEKYPAIHQKFENFCTRHPYFGKPLKYVTMVKTKDTFIYRTARLCAVVPTYIITGRRSVNV